MDKREARQILQAELVPFRAKPYAELVEMIGAEPVTVQRTGPSGREYQTELEVFWNDRPQGDVIVMGFIDDGGWKASFFPLCVSFVKSLSGEFLWE